MAGTRRTPINRGPTGPVFTPRSLEIFAKLLRAEKARLSATDCTISKYGKCNSDGECRACKEWWALMGELCRELKLPPWVWPSLPRNPWPPGSDAAKTWLPSEARQNLYDRLSAALKAQKAQAAIN
jgi:hypothetical protein